MQKWFYVQVKMGEFWGCRNYKGNEPMSCKGSVDQSKINWPDLVT